MLWTRKKTNLALQTGANRRKNAKLISELVASQHLSEAQNGGYARSLIWTIVLGLATFVVWASITPVYEIVSGNGTIKPEGLSTRIEHREGGIVANIHIAEGDTVKSGDILAVLDNTDLQAELSKLRASQQVLDLDIARNEWVLSVDMAQFDADGTPVNLIQNAPNLVEEVKYRAAQLNTMRAQQNVVSAQRNALQNQLVTADQELRILRAQVSRFETARTDNVIPLSRLEDLRREVLRLESNIAQLTGQVDVQTTTIAHMRATEAELVSQYRREASLQLSNQRDAWIGLRQSIIQIEDRLERAVLRAPVSGIVNALSVQNNGEVLGAGELFAEIIPNNTGVFAEIEVPADQIGGISVGREATIKVLTYDFTRYGDVAATVERISPSSFAKENGDVVFRVQLSFDQDKNRPAGQPVTSGMTIIADIKSEHRTVLSFLLKPVRVIADRALTEA